MKVLDAKNPAHLGLAARILREGGLVAFPTETVYGLGADALNPKAVCRIFEAKKRPAFDPLIVHVAKAEQAFALWRKVPLAARSLIRAFWPGPLSLVLEKSSRVPDVVTAGLRTVAVRMPDHAVARRLITQCGRPIAAPSANLFGCTSPTRASDVLEELGGVVDAVLDGGPCRVGVESTVLAVEKKRGVLLRPGGVTLEEIERFLPVIRRELTARSKIRSPGQWKSHYAPRTPMTLVDGTIRDFAARLRALQRSRGARGKPLLRVGLLLLQPRAVPSGFAAVEALCPATAGGRRGDLYEAASGLFHAMRKLDKMKLDWIAAEKVTERGIGLAIMDRLRKASGGREGF